MTDFTVDAINKKAFSSPTDFIAECEKRYKDRIGSIAREVSQKSGRELVMLAGPSSSGKTTTAKMLTEALKKENRKARVISLDDFYHDQGADYIFEDGTVDYETVKALDTECVYKCLHSLMQNGRAELPRFSFLTKKREEYEQVLCDRDEILIVEGLHALNPVITDPLQNESMKKLYVSVSSRVYQKDEVLLTKRDLRFVRRLIRDYHYRNSEVDYTFYLWKGVRMGEDRYLFPFSGRADIRIDSFHPYEPCFFKKECLKLLDLIEPDSIYYNAAVKLKQKISLFIQVEKELIPADSLLWEFIR